MLCPKCGEKSDNFTSCSYCGIIFQKYSSQEDLKLDLKEERQNRNQQLVKRFIFLTGGIVVAALLLLPIFTGEEEPDRKSENSYRYQSPQERAEANVAEHMGRGYYLWESGNKSFVITDETEHIKAAYQNFITIQQGRFAGGPRGFLVTKGCHAIIGKDLSDANTRNSESSNMRFNETNVSSFKKALEKAERDFESKRKTFIQNCKDCSQEAFDKALSSYISRINDLKWELRSATQELQQSRDKFDNAAQLQAKTNFGNLSAKLIETSSIYNISLVLLDRSRCDSLRIGNLKPFNEQELIFALSSSTSINAGKITGSQQLSGGVTAFTHNIGLKPRKHGTPLFNSQGELIAVLIKSTDNQLLALPIDTVLRILRMPL